MVADCGVPEVEGRRRFIEAPGNGLVDAPLQAVLELLARADFAAAQLARAEGALTRLLELAPSNAWARRALARTLERQSRIDAAAVHHRVADALGAA